MCRAGQDKNGKGVRIPQKVLPRANHSMPAATVKRPGVLERMGPARRP